MQWTSLASSVLASFLASMVEFVEALTIVLAVGVVRGWRSALFGTGAALLVLALLVLALGPALTQIPLSLVQGVVGALLLLFGLRWLRKAVLRASGVVPLHDETQAFAAETKALRKMSGGAVRATIDRVAFATAFKIVMLEGIEVVFIVIAIGAGGRLLVPAAIGALLALVVVALLGLWLHRPLANVPENALKFGVGVMLAAFGTFWVGEGIGLEWPGSDWTLVALIGAYLVIALALVPLCRQLRNQRRVEPASAAGRASSEAPAPMWRSMLAELVGLFVDDGLLAISTIVWVGIVYAWTTRASPTVSSATAATFFVGLAVLLGVSASRRARG